MYEITDEHPTPPPRADRAIYPFRKLEIGESFFVNDRPPSAVQVSTTAANRRLAPKRFTSRREDGGMRVWRIA